MQSSISAPQSKSVLAQYNKEVAFLVLYGGEQTEDATICIKWWESHLAEQEN